VVVGEQSKEQSEGEAMRGEIGHTTARTDSPEL